MVVTLAIHRIVLSNLERFYEILLCYKTYTYVRVRTINSFRSTDITTFVIVLVAVKIPPTDKT